MCAIEYIFPKFSRAGTVLAKTEDILSTGRCLNFYLALAQGTLFIDIPASRIDVSRKECEKKERNGER